MSLRYDVNFNRKTLEARARLRLMGLLRTLGITAFAGSLIALVALYGLLVNARHGEVIRLQREHARRHPTGPAKPLLTPAALELVMAAKASPELWVNRLKRAALNMPDDGILDEFEGDAGRDAGSPSRSATLVLGGHFPIPPGETSLTHPLTHWMDALQADTLFHRGLGDLRLESSRVITGTGERSVEFKIVTH